MPPSIHPPDKFSGHHGNPGVTSDDWSPPLPSFRHPLKDANFESHPGVQERGFQVRNDQYSRSIRSVIESNEQLPECQELREFVLVEFKENLFTSKRYDQVTREHVAKRGDFGTVHLEPIEGAKPKSCKAVRGIGLREKALLERMNEFQEKGYIYKAQDHHDTSWISRAFLDPKPNGKWRLVIDYRWLNSQLKGQNFAVPLIEDQLAKQKGNFMWTLVDLEDGFHQMRLAEDSQKYTGFITPFGVYFSKVLPMGVKVGSQVFQRMVAHTLNPCDTSGPYTEDVLTGTGIPPHQPKQERDNCWIAKHTWKPSLRPKEVGGMQAISFGSRA